MPVFMKPGSPFLFDQETGDIVGVKDSDGGEQFFPTSAEVAAQAAAIAAINERAIMLDSISGLQVDGARLNSSQYAIIRGASFKTPMDYGAIADGASHPISELYDSLELAKLDFPFATSLDNEIDFCAITKCLVGGGSVNLGGAENAYYVDNEITLPNNVRIYGEATIIAKSETGSYAPSVLAAFEKENIEISGITIKGPGGGRSGTWEPAGSLDGVGSCMLFAGCRGISVANTKTSFGSSMSSGNGVGNIYISSSEDVIISNNLVEKGDNGIVIDQWYTKLDGKSSFKSARINISGNVIADMLGRCIVVEHLDNDAGGEVVVTGNVLSNVLNAGIQIRKARQLLISNNTISMANIGRDSAISDGRNGIYGIDGAQSGSDISITGNIILNPRIYGMVFYNANKLKISGNTIRYIDTIGTGNSAPTFGIFIQNTDANNLDMVDVSNNSVECGSSGGIRFSKAAGYYGSSSLVSINGNVVNNTGGSSIYFDFPSDVSIKGNTCRPKNTYGGSIGIDVRSSFAPDVVGNQVFQCSTGLNYASCTHVNSANRVENCSSALSLAGNIGGTSADFIRGGINGFVVDAYGGGASMDATRARLSGTANVKNAASASVRVRVSGTAAPTVGGWGVGDVVDNTAPASGTAAFWACIASGTPGTWSAISL